MTTTMLPTLYSFRRCPYAMRARLALGAGPARDNRLPVGGIAMTAQEQADIVAFLGTLTDNSLPTDTRFTNPFIK